MRATGVFLLIAAAILFVGTWPAFAQEVTEHPMIRPYPGAVFDNDRSEYRSFGEYEFRVGVPPRNYETLTVQGEFRRLYYFLYAQDGRPNRDVSQLEYFENFKAAALQNGGEASGRWPLRRYLQTGRDCCLDP